MKDVHFTAEVSVLHNGTIAYISKEQQLDAFRLEWITVNTIVIKSENLIDICKQHVQLCLICYSTRLTDTV